MGCEQISPADDDRREPPQEDAAPVPFSRDELLDADDLPLERVDFPASMPGWGGRCVYVRSMTAGERDQWESFLVEHQTPAGTLKSDAVRATLVALCCADADGRLMFTTEDVEALSGKNAAALNVICDRARALNKLNADDIEELAKN